MMCEFNCLCCPYDDCIEDGITKEEKALQNEMDKIIEFEKVLASGDSRKISQSRYARSDKGHETAKRYNESAKGKARAKRYYKKQHRSARYDYWHEYYMRKKALASE